MIIIVISNRSYDAEACEYNYKVDCVNGMTGKRCGELQGCGNKEFVKIWVAQMKAKLGDGNVVEFWV